MNKLHNNITELIGFKTKECGYICNKTFYFLPTYRMIKFNEVFKEWGTLSQDHEYYNINYQPKVGVIPFNPSKNRSL